MSEQAIETEGEIITETPEGEVIAGGEEVEIVVEGEEKPTSKPNVPIGLRKRFNRLNGKIEAANTEADEVRKRAQMLEEENKLLRLQTQQTKRPKKDDFDTTEEYTAAVETYDDARIERVAEEKASQIVQQSQSQTSTANQNLQLQGKIESHYERANTLKLKNYEELEDKAIDILGTDLSKVIMANTAKSHLIMAHLGVNVGKAMELAELVKVDPVGAFAQAVEIGSTLSVKTKSSPPDPETKVGSGVAVSDWQKRVDKARDKAAESGDMKPLISLKKQAKEAGVKIG